MYNFHITSLTFNKELKFCTKNVNLVAPNCWNVSAQPVRSPCIPQICGPAQARTQSGPWPVGPARPMANTAPQLRRRNVLNTHMLYQIAMDDTLENYIPNICNETT